MLIFAVSFLAVFSSGSSSQVQMMKFRDYEMGMCVRTIACEMHQPLVLKSPLQFPIDPFLGYARRLFSELSKIPIEEVTEENWVVNSEKMCALTEEEQVDLYDTLSVSLTSYFRDNCIFNAANEDCTQGETTLVDGVSIIMKYTNDGHCKYDPKKAKIYGQFPKATQASFLSGLGLGKK